MNLLHLFLLATEIEFKFLFVNVHLILPIILFFSFLDHAVFLSDKSLYLHH